MLRSRARYRQQWQPKKSVKMLLVCYMPLARKIASKKPSNRAVRALRDRFQKASPSASTPASSEKRRRQAMRAWPLALLPTLTAALVPFASIDCMRPWLDTNTHGN